MPLASFSPDWGLNSKCSQKPATSPRYDADSLVEWPTMSASTQSLFSLYSPLAAFDPQSDGPNWATADAATSLKNARFGSLGLVLDGLPHREIAAVIRWSIPWTPPMTAQGATHTNCLEGATCLSPLPGSFLPQSDRSHCVRRAAVQLTRDYRSKPGARPTHTGGESQRRRRRSHQRPMYLARSDVTGSG